MEGRQQGKREEEGDGKGQMVCVCVRTHVWLAWVVVGICWQQASAARLMDVKFGFVSDMTQIIAL